MFDDLKVSLILVYSLMRRLSFNLLLDVQLLLSDLVEVLFPITIQTFPFFGLSFTDFCNPESVCILHCSAEKLGYRALAITLSNTLYSLTSPWSLNYSHSLDYSRLV